MASDVIKLLIVEDNDDDLEILKVSLESFAPDQFDITSSENLADALSLLSENDFDALLLDLGLSDSHGLTTLKKVGEHVKSIAVIVSTGLSDEAIAIEALSLGAQDYLVKGQHSGELIQRSIRYAIERKRMEVEREALKRQIVHSQKMDAVGTLAGGIAHDLNNMLTPITLFVEMGIAHDEPLSKPCFEKIKNATTRASDLIKRLLAFANKSDECELRSIHLGDAIEQALMLVEPLLPDGVKVDLKLAQANLYVMADMTELQQIMVNLLINASHALMVDSGGSIRISLGKDKVTKTELQKRGLPSAGDYARIVVKDNGSGIAQEHLERIFDPFFTTKAPGDGSGLGLSMCQSIIKRYEGSIEVKSELGVGTEFSIYLPIIENVDETHSEETSLSDLSGSSKILFIEDDSDLRQSAKDTLSSLGYQVTTIQHGKAALDKWGEDFSQFDLLITDQTMPQMSGLEFVKTIRAMGFTKPIIVTTGFSDVLTLDLAKEAGASDMVMKPLSLEVLAKKIFDLLRSSGDSLASCK